MNPSTYLRQSCTEITGQVRGFKTRTFGLSHGLIPCCFRDQLRTHNRPFRCGLTSLRREQEAIRICFKSCLPHRKTRRLEIEMYFPYVHIHSNTPGSDLILPSLPFISSISYPLKNSNMTGPWQRSVARAHALFQENQLNSCNEASGSARNEADNISYQPQEP